ncbi:hypothetical protein [Methylosinus sp. R-45379]|uniref:hypothetical protein n=1 Tax=Methylosinus sp. R-45379 TaxID=980563 RepID=UPI0007C98047|nr:hypothetical protein [Methylosinus sp. R-45379]
MKKYVALSFALGVFASIEGALAMPNDPDQSPAALGTVWNETEAGWQGSWTRVGKTEKYKAVWTKGDREVRADLTMSITGDAVSIVRRDTSGPGVGKGCQYSGTIKGSNVTGQYSCDWAKGPKPWSANIR